MLNEVRWPFLPVAFLNRPVWSGGSGRMSEIHPWPLGSTDAQMNFPEMDRFARATNMGAIQPVIPGAFHIRFSSEVVELTQVDPNETSRA